MRRHRGVSQILMISISLIILISSFSAVIMRNLAIKEGLAKIQANQMRDRSLQLAARSAATSMALKINDAWRILEIESTSELLLHELSTRPQSGRTGPGNPIQSWLEEKSKLHQLATQAASWFICDAQGTQVARYPYYEDPQKKKIYESIGKKFNHRDYFHGNGYDLSSGERADPAYISGVHLSCVYQSSNTANLKVAFSIPLWSHSTEEAEKQFMGILGYSVELGQFAVLQDAKESESFHQISVLADMRDHGRALGKSQYGLILQHPRMSSFLHTKNPRLESLPRLSPRQQEQIEEFRTIRVQEIRKTGFAASIGEVLLLKNFQDSFETSDSRRFTAACEPVCVVGRSEDVFDTGWLVIVEEASSTESITEAE